jgi:glycine oxidase
MDTKLQPKNNIIETDIIIVGQGIAGTVLALSYIQKGYSVCIISNNELSKSSRVAAGIWNPIVFKRLTKTWMADELIPFAKQFYSYAEEILKVPLYTERQILKPFTEHQEEQFWLKKSLSDNQYLQNTIYNNYSISSQKTITAYSLVNQAGNINLTSFLNEVKAFIINKYHYLNSEFNFNDLIIQDNAILYQTIQAKQIVFCEGYLMTQNPYFNWIPLKPAKGETLTIRSKDIHLGNVIFNKGFYILPLGDDLYKIGATYEWENLNDYPSEKGKEELINKISMAITNSFEILKHEAGVRPSIIDRRPVVGKHPEYPNVSILNGFGTKGVIIAPYFADYLIKLNENLISENMEVSPLRFYKK